MPASFPEAGTPLLAIYNSTKSRRFSREFAVREHRNKKLQQISLQIHSILQLANWN